VILPEELTVLENFATMLTLASILPKVILLVVGDPAGSLTTMIKSSDVNVVTALSSEIFGIAPSKVLLISFIYINKKGGDFSPPEVINLTNISYLARRHHQIHHQRLNP